VERFAHNFVDNGVLNKKLAQTTHVQRVTANDIDTTKAKKLTLSIFITQNR